MMQAGLTLNNDTMDRHNSRHKAADNGGAAAFGVVCAFTKRKDTYAHLYT